MKRNAEDVRVEGEEAAGAVKQRKEQEGGHVDWVVALQSPLVAEDIVRVLLKDPYEENDDNEEECAVQNRTRSPS